MITYTETRTGVSVKLEGKTVGKIRGVAFNSGPVQYQYQPAGSNNKGDLYPTLEACKASLESDEPITITEFEKAQRMHEAFSTLSIELRKEGRTREAEQTILALIDVPEASMARLYDIVQNVFNPKPRPLGEILGSDEIVGG